MVAPLFTPVDVGPVSCPNRIVVAPMCQYSSRDGCALDWHIGHLMSLAMSGAGLVMIEATAVERIGRITHGDLGLYCDDNERALGRALDAARAVALPGTRFGIQIAHAGRKASSQRPWEGGKALAPGEDPWTTVAPSAIALDEGWHTPEALDEAGIERIREAFVQTALRAVRLGFEVIELHMAHGYLLHAFHSPLSNHRDDQWGGAPARRMAYPLSVAEAVVAAVPSSVAVGARITGSDWTESGLNDGDAVQFARALRDLGCAYACVTSGGIAARARIPVGPGYQVPFAAKVKAQSGMLTRAVGMIVDPFQANDIIVKGQADQVALARGILDNPRWPWHAAEALGVELARPPQYERAAPKLWPGAAIARPASEAERPRKAS